LRNFQILVKFSYDFVSDCDLMALLYNTIGYSSDTAYYTEIFIARRKSFRMKMQIEARASTRFKHI